MPRNGPASDAGQIVARRSGWDQRDGLVLIRRDDRRTLQTALDSARRTPLVHLQSCPSFRAMASAWVTTSSQ